MKKQCRPGKLNHDFKAWELLLLAVLVLYPMRHVNVGGDLWDVGYNYGNFAYFSEEVLGKTWFFSTYLASAVGHLLTLLPFGHTVVGMNVYTGLFASILAVTGYLFCTRVLRISAIAAFMGEFLALGMCWCPTALLYNYLTYLLFLACVIFLYLGLTREKHWMLVAAGACLGTNVFVRFSNLPEMGLILAVWAYAIWDGWERRKKGRTGQEEIESSKDKAGFYQGTGGSTDNGKWFGKALGKLWKDTLWCLLGYLAALMVFFLWISLRYGMSDYVEGIRLLFAMTDSATDYKPISMLQGLLWPFQAGLYWILRLAFFTAMVFVVGLVSDAIPLLFHGSTQRQARKVFRILGTCGCIAVCIFMMFWILGMGKGRNGFTSFLYYSYDPVYWPCALFWMLALGIGAVEVLRPGNAKENRLYGMLLILVGVLTSLGSNNGIYPSFNNLFTLAPFVLQKVTEFTKFVWKKSRERRDSSEEFRPSLLPICLILWVFLCFCSVQFTMFGMKFVFCEGGGVQNANATVSQNEALKGLHMPKDRARDLQELSDFVSEEEILTKEVILHGNIPAVAFFLGMRPAFHSWNDLASFGYDVMQDAMDELMKEIGNRESGKPVVIAARSYAEYGPITPDDSEGVTMEKDPKWMLIQRFMGIYGYQKTFENERFVVWQIP
jgi:hypothetical protein